MGCVYLDVVLWKADYTPVFNANSDEVIKYLHRLTADEQSKYYVCVGRTLDVVTVDEYLTKRRVVSK